MAGITHLQEFSKPALRGLVNATEENKDLTFIDQYMPDDKVFSSTFAYDVIKKSNHIAAMIGYGAEPPVVDRDAVASEMGEVAKMGLKHIVTEEELLALNQARSGGEKSAMVESLTVKGVDLIQAIQKRVNVSKVEAIAKGSFSYNKNGVKIDVKYGIPEENKKTADWADEKHDVVGDLLKWFDQYTNDNGKEPDVILMSRETQAILLKNAIIIAESGREKGSSRANVSDLNAVLDGYGLPPVHVVRARKITVRDIYSGKDETIEVFPKNRVVMVAQGVGNYVYGPTVENDFQPGIDLRAYDNFEPIQSVIRVAAAGFPVIETPGLILHADVFEE